MFLTEKLVETSRETREELLNLLRPLTCSSKMFRVLLASSASHTIFPTLTTMISSLRPNAITTPSIMMNTCTMGMLDHPRTS